MAVENGWLPIESAPKDGTVILLAGPNEVYAACWAPVVKGDGFPWLLFEGAFNHSPTGCCDREDGERIEVNGWMIEGPTNWMPLPAPPKGSPQMTSNIKDMTDGY